MPGSESQNRCSFSRFLKVRRDGAEVMSTGRFTQMAVESVFMLRFGLS